MKQITPIRDKILGKMVDQFGETRQTKSGLFIPETNTSEDFIRPRWFIVTHVGPEQETVAPGDYVLVPHGRWSRGIDIDGTYKDEDKLFLLDNDSLLMVSDAPVS